LAYLIFESKWTQKDALAYLTTKRAIVNPNMTFMAQLINFHKRLYEESFNSITTSPRVFLVNSHEMEDAERIVPKMVRHFIRLILFLVNGKLVFWKSE